MGNASTLPQEAAQGRRRYWWVLVAVVVGEQSCLIGVQHVQKWCNFVGRSCHTRRFALQRNKSGPGSAVSRAPANLAAVPGSSQRRDGECGGWGEEGAIPEAADPSNKLP